MTSQVVMIHRWRSESIRDLEETVATEIDLEEGEGKDRKQMWTLTLKSKNNLVS